MNRIVTLDEFIIRRQKDFPYASGELTGLLRDIGVAAKIVNREVNKAGLVSILGKAGAENASGEDVQKLDLYANEKLIDCLKKLEPEDLRAIWLSRAEGETDIEVGRRLNRHRTTVASRAQNTLAALRECVEGVAP